MALSYSRWYSGYLTPVAADGGAMERAEALASLVSTARIGLVPPQLNLVR